MSSYHQSDRRIRDSITQRFAGLVLLLAATGCQSRSSTDYVPASNQARQAVKLVLESWKAGNTKDPMLQVADNGPRVQIFDNQRASGKKLAKFEIVKEFPAEPNAPKQFGVKLGFEGATADTETSYYVVGIDPLLVFRDSEYNQASSMGN